MNNSMDVPGNAPIRRTPEDLEKDRNETFDNFTKDAHLDWPNEAGVNSTTPTFTNQFENLTEHRGPIELPVKGTIPTWAAGSLFRNGPGAPGRTIENSRSTSSGRKDGAVVLNHWFDGLAHLHRFDIVPSQDDNKIKVIYSSRGQSDEFIKRVQDQGSFGEIVSFGQKADPCMGIFAKVMSCFKALDQGNEAMKYGNMNVTVQPGLRVPGLFSPPSSSTSNATGIASSGGHPDTARGTHQSKQVWLASDTSGLRAVDSGTLEPIGVATQTSLHPSLKGAFSCAHAQRCPKTGDYFNYNMEAGPKAIYKIFRLSAATGKTEILATISRTDVPMAYIHSFFLSERFLVLRIPVSHFGKIGLGIVWKKNLIEAIEPFDKTRKCKWIVVDRHHGQGVVAEFETPAAFFFHSVNCWDELDPFSSGGGRATQDDDADLANIFCDVIDFPNTNVLTQLYFNTLLKKDGTALKNKARKKDVAKSWSSKLVRWKFRVRLPTPVKSSPSGLSPTIKPNKNLRLAKPELMFEIKSPHAGELPTINPAFHTCPYRYVYSLPQNGKSTFLDTIIKTDLVTREVLQWTNPAGHTPGEAIFVPRPPREVSDATVENRGVEEEQGGEDDGILLSVVLDGFSRKSYLVCIDAKTMVEMGRAEMNFAVGEGLHGMHVPAG